MSCAPILSRPVKWVPVEDAEDGALFWVLRQPAPLAGMSFPDEGFSWQSLWNQGVRAVIRLEGAGKYDCAPLEIAHSTHLEDLYHGGPPSTPENEQRLYYEAARIAAERLKRREGVVVHCVGGRGRTGTVIACLLRTLGVSADEAITEIRTRRPTWPEAQWQEDIVRDWDGRPLA